MIDTHAHLDMPEFNADRNEVIARARQAGVHTIVTIGIDLASSRKAIALAAQDEHIYATVGCHPQEAGKMTEPDIAVMMQLAKNPKVVAIGEIGLDYYHQRAPKEKQLQVLQWQLDMAGKLSLPVVIHCREANIDLLPILKKWTASLNKDHLPGVIHCFNGSAEMAKLYLEMGFFLALGAYIGYPTSRMQDVIRRIPEDRLLIETDCPFLPPQSHRGKRNEPAYIATTLQVIAGLRNQTPQQIEQSTDKNAKNVFKLK
jgi:TatD DNase family protein